MQRREFLGSMAACVTIGGLLRADEKPRRDVPWLGEVQRAPEKLPADSPALPPLLVDAQGRPIKDVAAWRQRRDELRRLWLEFLQPLKLPRDQPPKLSVLDEDRSDGVIRQRVEYAIEPGIKTEAYLIRPAKVERPCPGVAVFHSTVDHSIRQPAGLAGPPEKFFGLKFAQRGCVTFSPRNFLWPDNDHIAATPETKRFQERHPGSKGMAKMLFDSLVAVDILASQPDVDPKRLGAIGHSLGAKEVLYLAAFDERIQVTISSEGGVGTRFSNWDAPWYLGPEIKTGGFTREQHELLGLIAPRPFLLLGGDSADGDKSWPFIAAALPVYRLFDDRPRIGNLNHKKGHAVPPEIEPRIYEWFATYL